MTLLLEHASDLRDERLAPVSGSEPVTPPSPRRAVWMIAVWLVVLVLGSGLVVYGFGPLFQQREQHRLLGGYRLAISRASNEASGLFGVEVPTKAPDTGSAVGILEVGRLSMQQVVVEGVGSSQTRVGPGHVPGTAGPGQPGNSVIVGRAHAFGQPFVNIGGLRKGNQMLVTTTQGQSVYVVDSVRHVTMSSSRKVDELYGPSKDDRLTLITSSSAVPWNSDAAVVVVAKMQTVPFAQTPQGGRTSSQTGLGGDSGAIASVLLALGLYAAIMAGSVYIYRRLSLTSAYLLTIAPAAAATVIAAETLSRLLPAWM
ncbi:MAG: class E sortase [Actinomycetota bacterium]|nr:class E sortase [Actinomycetota bacterium]